VKDKIKNILKFLAFLTIGLFLLWLVYKDQPMGELWQAIKKVNYFWILGALVISLSSHFSRAMRWKLLIKPLGYNPRISNVFYSVLVMYLSNTAIPRSGEIIRCGIVNKYEKIPFTKLLGTVFIERVWDFIMLIILMVIILFTQFDVVMSFMNNHPEVKSNISHILTSIYFLIPLAIIGAGSALAFYYLRNKIQKYNFYQKVISILRNFIEGLKTITKMEYRIQFLLHSIFIWSMYFLMLYFCFQSFEQTSHLSVLAALTVFVMTSFGMVAPTPGGIGAWHFMAIETLFIYGISKEPVGNAFALVAHGANTVFLLFFGFIAFIMLPISNNTNISSKKE
jgi:glycosyltransferase 2 family protein